jgi:hypothetical protein
MKNGESRDKIKAYRFWRFIGRSVVVIVILIVLVKLYNAIEIPKPSAFQKNSEAVESAMEKIRNHEIVSVSELSEAGIIGLNSSIMKTYAPITIMINDGEITPEFYFPINFDVLIETISFKASSFSIVILNDKGREIDRKMNVSGKYLFENKEERFSGAYLIGEFDSTIVTMTIEPSVTFSKEIENSGSNNCSGNSCGNN